MQFPSFILALTMSRFDVDARANALSNDESVSLSELENRAAQESFLSKSIVAGLLTVLVSSSAAIHTLAMTFVTWRMGLEVEDGEKVFFAGALVISSLAFMSWALWLRTPELPVSVLQRAAELRRGPKPLVTPVGEAVIS